MFLHGPLPKISHLYVNILKSEGKKGSLEFFWSWHFSWGCSPGNEKIGLPFYYILGCWGSLSSHFPHYLLSFTIFTSTRTFWEEAMWWQEEVTWGRRTSTFLTVLFFSPRDDNDPKFLTSLMKDKGKWCESCGSQNKVHAAVYCLLSWPASLPFSFLLILVFF